MISGNAESVLGVLAMYIQAQGESALPGRSLQRDGTDKQA